MENYECSSASSYSTGYSGHDVFSDASSGILEDRILEASTAHSSFETPDCLSGYNNALFSADPTHGVYDEPVKFDDDLTIPHRGSVNAYARNNNPYLRFEPDWQQMSHISFPWNVDEARMPTPQPRSLQPSEDSKLGLPAGGYPFCDEDLFGGRVDLRSISYDPSTPIERLQIVDPRATAFEQVWPSADQGVLIEKSNLPSHFQSRSPRNLPTTKVPDGVRKKNARFAIPEGRNLETIDRMITEAPTETLAKELKQQKRLLRNRQAALDSRQRKKAHTEQLEVTEHRLREEIANLTLQLQRYSIVDQNNRQEQLRLKAEIDRQQGLAEIERQEIIQEMQGTIDALRKQNRALEAKVNQLEASYDCRMPELRPSMDDRSHQDLHLTHLQVAKRSSSHPETVQIPIHNPQSPAASGMLLMLLICGAYVATRSQPSALTPISQLSEEVRVTSMRLLGDLFGSAGVKRLTGGRPAATAMFTSSPTIPCFVRPNHPGTRSSMVGVPTWAASHQFSSGVVDYISSGPSSHGLSVGQYIDLTALEFDHQPSRPRSPRKIELEDLYAAGRVHQPESVAMQYARALRHDTLSDEEIRYFASFVHEVEEQESARVLAAQSELPLYV